jgi:tRNA1(Val) A37 N6-methylase TrmN6
VLLSALPAVEKVVPGQGELVVTAPPERAAEISKALAEAGIYVTKLVPIRHTLESFFMEITGTDPTTGRGLS